MSYFLIVIGIKMTGYFVKQIDDQQRFVVDDTFNINRKIYLVIGFKIKADIVAWSICGRAAAEMLWRNKYSIARFKGSMNSVNVILHMSIKDQS